MRLVIVAMALGLLSGACSPELETLEYVEQRVITECAYVGKINSASSDGYLHRCSFDDAVCFVVERGTSPANVSVSCYPRPPGGWGEDRAP